MSPSVSLGVVTEMGEPGRETGLGAMKWAFSVVPRAQAEDRESPRVCQHSHQSGSVCESSLCFRGLWACSALWWCLR